MSDYLDRLISQAQESLWDTPVEEVKRDQRNAIQSDAFDRMTWATLNDSAPALSIERMELAEEYPTSPEAYEDLFNMLHQGDPLFRPEAAMEGEYVGNHALLSGLWSSDEFQGLRKDTKHDEYSTAFTMLAMGDTLREAFEALKNAQDAQAALQQALQDAQQASGPDEEAAAAQSLTHAMEAAQESQQGVDKAQMKLANDAGKAEDQLEADKDAAQAFGIGPGELQRMNFEERKRLMEKLHRSRMLHLSQLVGAFRAFGDAERRRKIQHAPAEIHNYVLSNDLTRLVPEELNNLAIPELEDQFWLRWSQHALLTKEVRGPEKAGKGPIIVVCDESGSMGGSLDGQNTREAWSKAVALALADQARRGHRDFHYIGFGSSYDPLYEAHFTGGQATLEQVIDFTEHFLNGGTDFMVPLSRAAEIIEDYERMDRSRPDVVFITDGACSVTEQFVKTWHERLERLDARCYGIQVGGLDATPALRAVSHKTMNITKLNANPEGVADLFRTL